MSPFAARVLWVLALSLAWGTALSAPPPGQSALLNGMHDIEAASWLAGATPGCDKGWITDLRYIGVGGTPGAACHAAAKTQGISIIQRLDASGSESFPHDASKASGYAQAFAHYVSQCADTHVWIVGNEPNFTVHKSDPDCSAAAYAASYAEVHKRVHALPGHAADLVLVASNSPYSPGCLESLRAIIDGIVARGVTPDGFALHAYTRASDAAGLQASLVTSTKTQQDGTIDECPGGASWNDTWHSHFRIYRDYIAVIESKGLAGAPVFITESGNACDPGGQGKPCYPDANIGYFQALYAEVAAHNAAPTTKTKIRAITPYRWTINDDGTGRDFAIGARSKLLSDLQQAFAKQHGWTTPDCKPGPTSCADDGDCPGAAICDLKSAACVATTPCAADGGCAGGELCRAGSWDCVPAQRGDATIVLQPSAPQAGAIVRLEAQAPAGYANVGMGLVGPSGAIETSWQGHESIGGLHHWRYDATLAGQGTYRATFRADPAGTVYGIRYFNVGAVVPPGADASPGDRSGAGPSDLGAPAGDVPEAAGDRGGGTLDGGCSCRVADDVGAASGFALLALLAFFRRRGARR